MKKALLLFLAISIVVSVSRAQLKLRLQLNRWRPRSLSPLRELLCMLCHLRPRTVSRYRQASSKAKRKPPTK